MCDLELEILHNLFNKYNKTNKLMVPIKSALNSLFHEYEFADNSPATINNEYLIIIGNYSTFQVEVMIELS